MIINGNKTDKYIGQSVLLMLDDMKYKTSYVAVEYNGEILPKNEYDKTILKENDTLEVVSFVGGG